MLWSQLILQNKSKSASKAVFVTRVVTVTMPNGRSRVVRQKIMKGRKFSNVRLPRMKGYKVVITGGLIAGHLGNHDENVIVKYVKL